jgi:uncharacterized cofD-like protein
MIVCFGGGKGLSATVRALQLGGRHFAAVVGTTDNGGSTGRLREEFGVPALGDFRRVVDSLSTGTLSTTMESRYKGHALGNLVLLDLVKRLGFKKGLDKYRKMMSVGYEIVPQFLEPNNIVAQVSGEEVFGEVRVDDSGGVVEKMWLEPELELNSEVLELVESADAIIIGPGSLYTSIMPHLISDDLAKKLSQVPLRVFVIGIKNDLRIVQHFKVSNYVAEVEKFVKLDHVLVQSPDKGVPIDVRGERFLLHDMSLDGHLHDPQKLGDVLCKLLK